ncbi:polymorphic toxin type 44 domain-containing protein [Pseudomonas alliivorans]|nr:polymorphic toxin type 44 domain-containing protein [Pseudomonas alliivorans]MEE5147324.1 polymorphic toxin type 44 domain-containing protein [Pseudomonas alliivorans]
MIPSARQGDLHVCPIPGHLPTPIVSASGDVLANVMNVARVGDVCACGAVIVSGFPSIWVNGRPMAHLGSPTSHGGMIVNGSPDVVGGFNASSGGVVDFSRLGMLRDDGSVDEVRLDALMSDPELLDRAEKAGALVDAYSPAEASRANSSEQPLCEHPDKMEQLAGYIAEEMNRNVFDTTVLRIKELLKYNVVDEMEKWLELPWYAQLGAHNNPQEVGRSNSLAAMAMWTEKVGQNRPWDHKVELQKIFGVWHKQGPYDYFYDIWSNIHYGYIGTAAGFSKAVLLDGAGLEQIASDAVRFALNPSGRRGPHRFENIEGLRAWDDAPDRISITIGMELYESHPMGGLTATEIMNKVLGVGVSDWECGVRVHECYGGANSKCQ